MSRPWSRELELYQELPECRRSDLINDRQHKMQLRLRQIAASNLMSDATSAEKVVFRRRLTCGRKTRCRPDVLNHGWGQLSTAVAPAPVY